MKIVIQRVSSASVKIDKEVTGAINKGYVIFLGVGKNDTKADVDKYVDKIIKLRIFSDEEGKTNLSLKDVEGELLVISQFTLYADCKKGNRPNFLNAGSPESAEALYEYFIKKCKEQVVKVESGSFGADMKVELVNDGPFTVVLGEDI